MYNQTFNLQQAIGRHKPQTNKVTTGEVGCALCTSYQKTNVYMYVCMWYMRITNVINTSICVSTIYVKTIAKLCVAQPQLQVQTEFHPRFFPFACCIELDIPSIKYSSQIYSYTIWCWAAFRSSTVGNLCHNFTWLCYDGFRRSDERVCSSWLLGW